MARDLIAFANYIDKIRNSRDINREDLVDDIVSERQYRRFLKGKSQITIDKLVRIIDRLGTSFYPLYNDFIYNKDLITHDLLEAYRCMSLYDYKKTSDLIKEINENEITSTSNQQLYKHIEILTNFHLGKIPESIAIRKLKMNIDYPNVLSKNILNVVELGALIFISDYEIKTRDNKSILEFLYDILKNDLLNENQFSKVYRQTLYSALALSMGRLDEYEKALKIAEKGIHYSKKNSLAHNLPHLMMSKILALKSLNREDEALQYSKKMFSLLYGLDRMTEFEDSKKIIEKYFMVKLKEVFPI